MKRREIHAGELPAATLKDVDKFVVLGEQGQYELKYAAEALKVPTNHDATLHVSRESMFWVDDSALYVTYDAGHEAVDKSFADIWAAVDFGRAVYLTYSGTRLPLQDCAANSDGKMVFAGFSAGETALTVTVVTVSSDKSAAVKTYELTPAAAEG